MANKPVYMPMMPAPRARPINDAASTQALVEATHDLGFGRKTSSAEAADPADAPPVATPVTTATETKDNVAGKPKVIESPTPVPSALLAPLKFDIDRDLSNFLKMEAVRRGATVKFLILEALAGKGYPVDMANTPEDGRRPRRET